VGEIKDIVRKLVRKYKTSNPYELADYLNIIVLIDNLDESIRGYFHYFKRNKIIHINSKLSDKDKRIVLAHELGHAVLHPKLNIIFMEHNTYFVKSKYEYEANKFAAEILVPDDLLSTYPDYTLQQISCLEGIPEYLIELKFSN
jgi:Zn-dependent peptidase ImmA (M78 family)